MLNNTSNKIRKLNEEYEENLFRLIMDDVAKKEGLLLYEESNHLTSKLENELSQEKIKRFSKTLDVQLKNTKKSKKDIPLNFFRKTAIAVTAIIVLFSTLILTVHAYRIQMLNFLIKVESKYTSLQLDSIDYENTNGNLLVNWTNAYVPTYIPEDFQVNSISNSHSIRIIQYSKKDDISAIIYTDYESNNSVAIDTENALVESIKINGEKGTIAIKDSTVVIAWKIENHLFTVQGEISKDEAVKIAESVKFIK